MKERQTLKELQRVAKRTPMRSQKEHLTAKGAKKIHEERKEIPQMIFLATFADVLSALCG